LDAILKSLISTVVPKGIVTWVLITALSFGEGVPVGFQLTEVQLPDVVEVFPV